MRKRFDYIGYVHSSHKPYGRQKEITYHIVAKSRGKYKVERLSEYSGTRSSSWYNLKQLKRKIGRFDHITMKGNVYLEL